MAAIQCIDTTKVLDGRRVVDGLELNVEPGEVLGLLGPNGAGKTTTIRMILGLTRPTSGEIRVLGQRVPVDPETAASIGAIVEEPHFYPWMTGRQNLRVLLDSGAPAPADLVDLALEQVDLADVATTKVKRYSQGMRQRLGVAAALLRRPKVLILDEPANGLDPTGIRDLRLLLRRLADSGSAILVSSHQLGEVELVCDRVAVINKGRLVACGLPEELGFGQPRIRVVVAANEVSEARAVLAPFDIEANGDGVLYVDAPSGREVNERLQEAGIVPESVAVSTPTLEERFLALVDGAS